MPRETLTSLERFLFRLWHLISSAWLALSVFCLVICPSTSLAWSCIELMKALEGSDIEAAWKSIRSIPEELSLAEREKTVEILMATLPKEWSRCTGDIRQEIAQKLADFQTERAISQLIELIREGRNIDHECAECGCCFAYQSVEGAFLSLEPDFFCENGVLAALHSLVTFSYAKDVSELAKLKAPYRPQLLAILGKIGSPRYAYFIANFSDSENDMTRLAVACALGEMQQQSGIPVLGRLLEDSNESVRWAASNALIRIAGDRVVDTVRLRLMHPDEEVRALSARTLGVLGVVEGLSVLRTLASEEENAHYRSLAIAYLGQLQDIASRSISLNALQDTSVLVRVYAIYALGHVGEASDIPAMEACLYEVKNIAPAPTEKGALELIDETTRESIEQIRSRQKKTS